MQEPYNPVATVESLSAAVKRIRGVQQLHDDFFARRNSSLRAILARGFYSFFRK